MDPLAGVVNKGQFVYRVNERRITFSAVILRSRTSSVERRIIRFEIAMLGDYVATINRNWQ